MDQLRKEARQALEQNPQNLPDRLPSATKVKGSLSQLWEHVSQYDNHDYMTACESLFTALVFLDLGLDPQLPKEDGVQSVAKLFKWASNLALPSSEFKVYLDDTVEETPETKTLQDQSRIKGKLALDFIVLLTAKTDGGIPGRGSSNSPDVILAAIAFNSNEAPWTTEESQEIASMQLDVIGQYGLWPIIEDILREKLKPLFTKQRNPNITSQGRKDLHPVPLPRFDGSTLDDSLKPWKSTDIYTTSALSWIISQYKATEMKHLEAHIPLLVPAILAVIDDSNITCKAKGCQLLDQLLSPIQESGSDILIRTGLISVFEEAVTPCLLSLPTITPEEDSLKILKAAYPVIFSLIKVEYSTSSSKGGQSRVEQIKETYKNKLANVLRSNLISSFNHVSYSASSTETSASFPYPRLSSFLLNQISHVLKDLRIETTKYIQDILPLLQSTLSNPFGSAHLPLLSAAISATRSLVLMAYPRVWRWRGELFDGLCACWLHVREETAVVEKEKRQDSHSKDCAQQLTKVTRELKVVVIALKHALQNPVAVGDTPDPDQAYAKEHMEEELNELVKADLGLRNLLIAGA